MPSRTFKGTCALCGASVDKRRSAAHYLACAPAREHDRTRRGHRGEGPGWAGFASSASPMDRPTVSKASSTVVEPGSRVHTDGWLGYDRVKAYG